MSTYYPRQVAGQQNKPPAAPAKPPERPRGGRPLRKNKDKDEEAYVLSYEAPAPLSPTFFREGDDFYTPPETHGELMELKTGPYYIAKAKKLPQAQPTQQIQPAQKTQPTQQTQPAQKIQAAQLYKAQPQQTVTQVPDNCKVDVKSYHRMENNKKHYIVNTVLDCEDPFSAPSPTWTETAINFLGGKPLQKKESPIKKKSTSIKLGSPSKKKSPKKEAEEAKAVLRAPFIALANAYPYVKQGVSKAYEYLLKPAAQQFEADVEELQEAIYRTRLPTKLPPPPPPLGPITTPAPISVPLTKRESPSTLEEMLEEESRTRQPSPQTTIPEYRNLPQRKDLRLAKRPWSLSPEDIPLAPPPPLPAKSTTTPRPASTAKPTTTARPPPTTTAKLPPNVKPSATAVRVAPTTTTAPIKNPFTGDVSTSAMPVLRPPPGFAGKPLVATRTVATAPTTTTPTKKPTCRYGEKCTNVKCTYDHPQRRDINKPTQSTTTTTTKTATTTTQQKVVCKFGKTCDRETCTFAHPQGRTKFPGKDKPSTGTTVKPFTAPPQKVAPTQTTVTQLSPTRQYSYTQTPQEPSYGYSEYEDPNYYVDEEIARKLQEEEQLQQESYEQQYQPEEQEYYAEKTAEDEELEREFRKIMKQEEREARREARRKLKEQQ